MRLFKGKKRDKNSDVLFSDLVLGSPPPRSELFPTPPVTPSERAPTRIPEALIGIPVGAPLSGYRSTIDQLRAIVQAQEEVLGEFVAADQVGCVPVDNRCFTHKSVALPCHVEKARKLI